MMSIGKKKNLLDRRRTVAERIAFIAGFCILTLWALLLLYMLFWAVTSSFKTNIEYVLKPLALPENLKFENYKIGLEKFTYNGVNFTGMLYNSLWQTVGAVVVGQAVQLTTGYILAQYEFKGKNILFSIMVFGMIVPLYGSFASTYKLYFDLGLTSSYKILIASLSGFNATTLMTYAFFKGTPKELREAVFVDGGGDWVAYTKVYLPLAKNIFIAFFILGFISGWNDYQTPLLYMDGMPTLSLGLYVFQQEIRYVANNPAYFAGSIMVCLPVVIMFVVFNDKIMGQIYSGGLKG